jgi:FKBP-type peptidyl-prolyl cis-trans isomerase FkpA
MKIFIVFTLIFLYLYGCDNRPKEQPSIKVVTQKDVEEKSKEANRQYTLRERDELNIYLKNHSEKFTQTGSGLYYHISKTTNKVKVKQGQLVTIDYLIKLLDGTVCYTSKEEGQKKFVVGGDNVETGLHEALLLMKIGESGRFILPSHLAHGLLGDMDKIPPKAVVIYDIELISVE